MALGSKIVPVRLTRDLFVEMHKAIHSRNKASQEEPWNVSDFIRHCIRVKLNHNARAKKVKGKKAKITMHDLLENV